MSLIVTATLEGKLNVAPPGSVMDTVKVSVPSRMESSAKEKVAHISPVTEGKDMDVVVGL